MNTIYSKNQNFIEAVKLFNELFNEYIMDYSCFQSGNYVAFLKAKWLYDEELLKVLGDSGIDITDIGVECYSVDGIFSGIVYIFDKTEKSKKTILRKSKWVNDATMDDRMKLNCIEY